MSVWLKQSTAIDVSVGPFVDSGDGNTTETTLTITQPDIRLKKNGGAWAQKNAAQTLTHEENGWYEIALDATDTNTLGSLLVAVHESGALPVWREFMVVPANVWDSLFGADLLQVDTREVTGTSQTAGDLAALITAVDNFVDTEIAAIQTTLGTPAGASISADIAAIEAQTDDIGVAGAGLTAVPWNAAWDAEVQSEVADALAVYDPPTHAELVSEIDAVQTDVAGVQSDTNDIQARLPAALVSGRMSSDMVAISGDTTAADALEAMMDGVFIVQVNGVATTTSIPIDGFTSTRNDQFNGRLITILDGSGEQTDITDYVHATQTLVVTALSAAPGDNVFIAIH